MCMYGTILLSVLWMYGYFAVYLFTFSGHLLLMYALESLPFSSILLIAKLIND